MVRCVAMNGDEAERLGEKLLAEVEVTDLSEVRETRTMNESTQRRYCSGSDIYAGTQGIPFSKV